ncbi:UDP-N-acetylmuramate--L-alanine ligase [Oscillatoria sp. CS-180]|uniref:UDP-N-acetylmuramate--L-alanine ligase n=1 Tax=Oscillatoria sp. CS-180 TaxID=3021720 RepID=UPI00232B1B3D|nr:UDP-N-acetylmuramate--L-alanine ligase [Oscillatoria sp. CS-180]MDB9528512.1 UDP-N-acetylmuramate--L-alanine ligase [Oscillatoria sp. CS-180]
MLNSVDFSGRPFHFIGIGGIGMSALAYVLTQQRLPVSGSDLRLSHITQRLQEAGAHIFWRQEADNLSFFEQGFEQGLTANYSDHSPVKLAARQTVNLPQVVCSTAINESNDEYRAALKMGCPIFHRSDLLAALMKQYKSIAVAGTHGKTTTSSMMGYALLEGGIDPTMVVGGEVSAWEGNARLGMSNWFVAEADESDGSLVKLTPEIGIITNIELDHPDHYNSLEDVVDIFRQFSQQTKTVIASIDCATVRSFLNPDITYSVEVGNPADYTVTDVVYSATGTRAAVWERGNHLGVLRLAVPGKHNLSNALAVIAAGRCVGVDFDALAAGLAQFEGARRRFERRGFYSGIQFVDDYAHHPSEIKATLSTARLLKEADVRLGHGVKRIFAIFQPHRYSRTAAFLDDFAQAFNDADEVIITDVYGAGEEKPKGFSAQVVARAIAEYHPHVQYCSTLEAVSAVLTERLQPGDMALFLGAGNLNRIIPEVMEPFVNAEIQAVQQA